MPTVIGTRVKCPECGATTLATGDVVRCSYCGAESRAQSFKLPPPLPAVAPEFAAQVAAQRKNAKLIYIGVGFIILATAIIPRVFGRTRTPPPAPVVAPSVPAAAPPAAIVQPAQTDPQTESKPPAEIGDWLTARPMFVDVDGDSVADPIGMVRYARDRDEVRLTAHSGKDGHPLWESESLGSYVTSFEATLARVDGVVVWASTAAPVLSGFDIQTGKQLWKVTPAEVVDHYCHANDHVLVVLKDNTQLALDRATGTLTKLAKPISCREAARQGDVANNHLFEIKGFNVDQHYKDADGTVFAGIKWPGVSVQMVAASDRNGKVLWTANLAAHAELRAARPAWPTLDFDSDVVAEPVLYEGKTPYLEVFDRKTGARKLDVPITVADHPGAATPSKISTTVGKDAIYLVVQADLQAYAKPTGALLWHLKR